MVDRSLDARPQDGTTRFRQGETPGVVRWVLLISTLLAIVAMVVCYWWVHGFRGRA